jgi:H+-translocating NAD(P) transhydrogenase subunit alpha
MRIAVPKETAPDEKRVAMTPETAKRLIAKKFEVSVERGAGLGSQISDADYEAAGARIEPDAASLWAAGDVVVKVRQPSDDEVALLREGGSIISLLYPLVNHDLLAALNRRRATVMASDMIPRTTLAQMMDVLSSQATVAGYRAVLLAAEAASKMFPMMMTAAGTIAPSKVLILGAGVAGLQAIGTARRLGAGVEAFDVRTVVKEQVESLGAKFIEVPSEEDGAGAGGYAKEVSEEYKKKQAALLLASIAKSDCVITTALIPGRRAPILVTADMVKAMKSGAVVVDLAAEQGGNCELTKPGQRFVTDNGVVIVGERNLPSQISVHASQMFSRNMEKLLLHISKEGEITLDLNEEIAKGLVIARDGNIVHEQVAAAAAAAKKELAA